MLYVTSSRSRYQNNSSSCSDDESITIDKATRRFSFNSMPLAFLRQGSVQLNSYRIRKNFTFRHSFVCLFCLNLGPFGPFGPLQDSWTPPKAKIPKGYQSRNYTKTPEICWLGVVRCGKHLAFCRFRFVPGPRPKYQKDISPGTIPKHRKFAG